MSKERCQQQVVRQFVAATIAHNRRVSLGRVRDVFHHEPRCFKRKCDNCDLHVTMFGCLRKIYTKRSLKMPLHLVLQLDNTTRENKNSIMLVLMSALVARGRFESVSFHFHRVGHTHGPLDQRFSIVAQLLAREEILQTSAEFAQAIRDKTPASRNREVVAQELNDSWDLKEFAHRIGVHVSGLTPNPKWQEWHVCHCWRIVQRRSLDIFKKASASD